MACCCNLRVAGSLLGVALAVVIPTWMLSGRERVSAQGGNAKVDKSLFPADGPVIPKGLPEVIFPDDNEYSAAKAELGWLLFFDKRLSADGSVSCASCHD